MAITIAATLQAADVGKQIQFTQLAGSVNFTGATVTLYVLNITTSTTTSYTCGIDPTNSFPVYTTVGTEFPTAGKYQLQLVYTNGGEVYHADVVTIQVQANLG
jgi:hypothetical protein